MYCDSHIDFLYHIIHTPRGAVEFYDFCFLLHCQVRLIQSEEACFS